MFGTIRKHQTWLWFIVIGVTILSMLMFFGGPSSQYSRSAESGNFGNVDGKKVTRDAFESALKEAYLAYFFRNGPESRVPFEQATETYQRIFLIQKLQEFHIEVDDDSVAREAGVMLQESKFSLDKLLQAVSRQVAVRDTDFARFVRHNLGVQQLALLLGLGGDLVTPQEAQSFYIRRNQELATEAAFFSGSNYLASVTAVPPDALASFYTNQMPVYSIPDRMQVSYVKFELTNFLAAADVQIAGISNFNELVEQEYLQRGSNYFHDAKTPEAAKDQLRWQIRREMALSAAYKSANEFAVELFNLTPMRPENLATLAKTKGLTNGVSRPFDEVNGPEEFDGGPNFAKSAFRLNAEMPFAERVLMGQHAAYVIALDRKIPREIPPLEQIRERVVADFKHNQAVMLARMAGLEMARALTNGLAGKTFNEVCAQARVKPVVVPPVSRSTSALPLVEDHVNLRQYQNVAFATPPGKISEFISTRDGGFIVYVRTSLPLDEARLKAELPEFLQQLRQARRQEAFSAWFNREGSRALREVLNPGQGRPAASEPGS